LTVLLQELKRFTQKDSDNNTTHYLDASQASDVLHEEILEQLRQLIVELNVFDGRKQINLLSSNLNELNTRIEAFSQAILSNDSELQQSMLVGFQFTWKDLQKTIVKDSLEPIYRLKRSLHLMFDVNTLADYEYENIPIWRWKHSLYSDFSIILSPFERKSRYNFLQWLSKLMRLRAIVKALKEYNNPHRNLSVDIEEVIALAWEGYVISTSLDKYTE
jgi:hypothetical protein